MLKPLILTALLGSLFIIVTSDKKIDTSSEESKENSTERSTEMNTEKSTAKFTEKTSAKPIEKTTDKHIDNAIDKTTETSIKRTTDKPVKKLTETYPDTTTKYPTKSFSEKPHSPGYQNKTTEISTKRTTDKPVKKITETYPDTTTEYPTKSFSEKPHSPEYRIRCAENEKYERCPNKVREPQTCEHLGFPCKDCDKGDEDDDCSDTGACICVKGYLRGRHGACMPADNCPSCGGDKNATLGCGINCGRRCSDYKKEVQCLEVCFINQCDCRDDYVLDEFTGKCVLPKDCSRKNLPPNKNEHNNKPNSGKSDSNEEDDRTDESDSDEDDNDWKCNKNSNNHKTGVSTTTPKPTSSSSKCYEESMTLFVRANFGFAGTLLKELMWLKPGQNVMVSSPAVLNLLAQSGISADGETYTQIMTALNFNNVELIKCFFKRILPVLRSLQSAEYRLIVKTYSDNVCPLTRDFRKQTKNIFAFEPDNLDFQNPKSAKIISQEIAEQTNNHFVDYIKPSFLKTLSGLVLVTAEYFQGRWQKQFDPQYTKQRDFYVSNSKTIKVNTMYHQTDTFLYTESSQLDAKILKLKYTTDDFTLAVVLPNRIDGLKNVLDKLRQPDLIIPVLNSLKMENLEIYLPTFNMTVAHRLREHVKTANVTSIFRNETAGLEDITLCSGTYISEILEKATLKVDEFGKGHSKSTDFDMEEPSPIEKNRRSYTFRANHPFTYMLFYHKILTYQGVYLR